jgi:hypothetical protein
VRHGNRRDPAGDGRNAVGSGVLLDAGVHQGLVNVRVHGAGVIDDELDQDLNGHWIGRADPQGGRRPGPKIGQVLAVCGLRVFGRGLLDGVCSRNGKNRTLSFLKRSKRPELALLDLLVLPPDVVAGQVDVLPAQRRKMR